MNSNGEFPASPSIWRRWVCSSSEFVDGSWPNSMLAASGLVVAGAFVICTRNGSAGVRMS